MYSTFQNNVHTAKQMQYTLELFYQIIERRFLNLLREYRNVNGTLEWEKPVAQPSVVVI